jgi:colicin import membrane protein
MALSQDIKDRIFAAADELYAITTDGEYPNVEAVRQRSRAGMNNVVEAMKEWRQRQRTQVQAVREPLPADLQGVVQTMGQHFWETAQQLANESLDAAKIAFEAEKSDLVQLSNEQSEAYELQVIELSTARDRIVELERTIDQAAAAADVAARNIAESRDALLAAEQRVALAEQKAEDVEHRADDLRVELTHAHGEVDRLRLERDKAQERAEAGAIAAEKADARTEQVRELMTVHGAKADTTIEQLRLAMADQVERAGIAVADLRAELATARGKADAAEQQHEEQRKRAAEEVQRIAERMTKAETERDNSRAAVAEAREEAATLRGQLDATKAMLATLTGAPPTPAPKRGKQ